MSKPSRFLCVMTKNSIWILKITMTLFHTNGHERVDRMYTAYQPNAASIKENIINIYSQNYLFYSILFHFCWTFPFVSYSFTILIHAYIYSTHIFIIPPSFYMNASKCFFTYLSLSRSPYLSLFNSMSIATCAYSFLCITSGNCCSYTDRKLKMVSSTSRTEIWHITSKPLGNEKKIVMFNTKNYRVK